jgi:hypothetical protein
MAAHLGALARHRPSYVVGDSYRCNDRHAKSALKAMATKTMPKNIRSNIAPVSAIGRRFCTVGNDSDRYCGFDAGYRSFDSLDDAR